MRCSECGKGAEVLKVDPRTVKRDWKVARIFLLDKLSGGRDGGT